MDHRHLTNSMQSFEIDQHQNPNGRAITPANVSLVYPVENVPRSIVFPAIHQNMESRPIEHSSLSFGPVNTQVPVPHSAPSFDSFRHLPGFGNFYSTPENGTNCSHSVNDDRFAVCGVDDGLVDYGMNAGRGQFKRKNRIPSSCERGSPSTLYNAGSSSNSFGYHLDEPTSAYPNYPPSTIGPPQYWGANLSVHSQDPARNVRSRSRIDLHNPRTTHPSSYSSNHYFPTAYQSNDPGGANIPFGSGTTTYNQNNLGISYSAQGRFGPSGNAGLRDDRNPYFIGGSAAEAGGYRREPVSSAQYFDSQHDQAAVEVQGNHSLRAVPSYSAVRRSSHWQQAAAPTANGPSFNSEAYSSRFSRPYSSRSWRNNHREPRSRIADERFQPFPNSAHPHYRTQLAGFRAEHPFSYGSRSYIDEYQDMRLDVDNMSYEELLALGERIGNVNTGLSEDVLSGCLKETTYSLENCQEEATCAICLEEYKKEDEIGAMNCRHDFHIICIKRWLAMKNACPICKAPAHADISKDE